MRFYITLEDLTEEAARDIKRILVAVLGLEAEQIESFLEEHDFRIPVEL